MHTTIYNHILNILISCISTYIYILLQEHSSEKLCEATKQYSQTPQTQSVDTGFHGNTLSIVKWCYIIQLIITNWLYIYIYDQSITYICNYYQRILLRMCQWCQKVEHLYQWQAQLEMGLCFCYRKYNQIEADLIIFTIVKQLLNMLVYKIISIKQSKYSLSLIKKTLLFHRILFICMWLVLYNDLIIYHLHSYNYFVYRFGSCVKGKRSGILFNNAMSFFSYDRNSGLLV